MAAPGMEALSGAIGELGKHAWVGRCLAIALSPYASEPQSCAAVAHLVPDPAHRRRDAVKGFLGKSTRVTPETKQMITHEWQLPRALKAVAQDQMPN